MKILKLLNKKNLSIIFITLIFGISSHADDHQPVDIWNLDKNKIEEISKKNLKIIKDDITDQLSSKNSIYKMQTKNEESIIEFDQTLESKKIKIVGLYDPEKYGLNINMWSNTDGKQLKKLFVSLDKMKLSDDASEILNISLLTNAYQPNQNITEQEFLNIKSDWLIKNSNLELIEKYLIKNQNINLHLDLTRYLVDEYLSESNVEKSCEIFSKITESIEDNYLFKFNLYCLINNNKIDEAQLILDLKKELGFEDNYYEKKINYLFGYTEEIDENISEVSLLDFHLAHRTNPQFLFEPKENTSKLIWKYLSTSNLLYNIDDIEITELDKISTIEKATHDKNYSEEDLYELYKRFQFNINQLLNVKESYKSLPGTEGRALVYQRILLTSEISLKMELMKILKDLFVAEDIGNAFDQELKKFLGSIKKEDVPSNFTTFYNFNIQNKENIDRKIKFNTKVMHQSKLVNYFTGKYTKSKIEEELNNFLKKIKKDKKYFISKKDIIFLEALRSDGIKIAKKYQGLYEINKDEIPEDIQSMINNNETGAALLRIAEVIGQDKIENIDDDTIYFVIGTLNQLNVDIIRNKFLLKILPLKV